MRIDVYEMFKGRLIQTFWVDLQAALDYALAHYQEVPDEAGLAVVESGGRKPVIPQISDVAELVARGYRVIWRVKPNPNRVEYAIVTHPTDPPHCASCGEYGCKQHGSKVL